MEKKIKPYSHLFVIPHQKPRGLRLHSLRLFVPGASNGPRFLLDCVIFMFKFLTLYYTTGSSNIGMKPPLVNGTNSSGPGLTAVMGGRLIPRAVMFSIKALKYFWSIEYESDCKYSIWSTGCP